MNAPQTPVSDNACPVRQSQPSAKSHKVFSTSSSDPRGDDGQTYHYVADSRTMQSVTGFTSIKFTLFFSALFIVSLLASAQSGTTGLYMPLEFQKAYDHGTRQPDGKVSAAYWQNRSDYKLKARIDPVKKVLYGEGIITYYNNSPDTITRIVFHTYADYYRKDSKHNSVFFAAKFAENDGMEITNLAVDGQTVSLTDKTIVDRSGTHYQVKLMKTLAPRSSLRIDVGWHYEIPGEGFERSGAIDSTSMFIGYWYPEMSVRDDIDAWDRIVYDASTEFYHDYSDYEVEISAPDNFVVWASVPPDNPSEVYSPAVLERLSKARKSAQPISIYAKNDFHKDSDKTLTWKYTARDFPDFAFALSDHFVWEAASYKDSFGDYFMNVAYPADKGAFAVVLKTMSESLRIFHTKFPVLAFPYEHFVIFDGFNVEGGGMEFPGMANNALITGEQMQKWTGVEADDFSANLPTSLHEMCHMYFPFLMGINEKKYAWMEEGMATFSESFSEHYSRPDAGPGRDYDRPFLGSLNLAPVMVPSWALQRSQTNAYIMGAASYNSLYRVLGRELFLQCLHGYMNEWKHKHPTPYDFMNTFNRISGKDLTWFWKRWYFDWGYLDMAIKDFSNNVLTIENRGGKPIAIDVIVRYQDGSSKTEAVDPSVWKDSTTYSRKVDAKKKVASIMLLPGLGPDAMTSNNRWQAE